MITKRLLAVLSIAAFTWLATEASVFLAIGANDSGDSPSSASTAGFPCPDGDDEGPCDGDCPCTFCPGHVKVLYSDQSSSPDYFYQSIGRSPGLFELDFPTGISQRVFRPPRV